MDAVHPPTPSRPATPARLRRGRPARILAPAVAVLVATMLAACSPAPRRIVAVFLDGEAPTILLQPCSEEPVKGIQVRDVTAAPSATAGPTGEASATDTPTTVDVSLLRWDISSADRPAPVQLRLLTVPDGWTLHTDSDRRLREFREDRTYEVSTSVIGDLGVEFTLADLAALEPGQVWATPGDTRTARAMSRNEFTALAADSCD